MQLSPLVFVIISRSRDALVSQIRVFHDENPNRYAWFNGVDPKAMRATDGTLEGAEQCVEVESYKGKQEWECE